MPSDCQVTYELTFDDGVGGAEVQAGPIFTLYNASSNDRHGLVEFHVTGYSGSAEATAIILVNLLDPCPNTNFVTLELTSLTASYSYVLGQDAPNGKQIVHDTLNVVTTPTQHSLCGAVAYEATFNGNIIGPSDSPMSYDEATRTFAFYSESVNFEGDQAFAIKAYLVSYPDRFKETSAILSVAASDPCASDVVITPSFMVPQEYTITDPAKIYQFMPYTTDPPGCPVTYTYLVNPGAAANAITFD